MRENISQRPQYRQSVALQKLERVRSKVGPARQKVIDYVLNHAEEVIYLSVTELAELAGASEASIVRLFQELGYKGYQDFKIQLSQTLSLPDQSLDRDISPHDPPGAVLAAVFDVSVTTLKDTKQAIDEAALNHAVELLAQAARIEFIGSGGSGIVAMDAYHKFIRLGLPVNAALDGHNAAQICAVLKPGDVVVIISHSGSSRDVLEAASLAKESGAAIIAITHYGRSPLHKFADVLLSTLSPETNYRSEAIASRIAQLALIDALMISVYLARQPQSAEMLSRARKALNNKRL